jgi:hypothetical protein
VFVWTIFIIKRVFVWVQWCTPVVPVTQEAKTRDHLNREFGANSDSIVRPPFQKKKKKYWYYTLLSLTWPGKEEKKKKSLHNR